MAGNPLSILNKGKSSSVPIPGFGAPAASAGSQLRTVNPQVMKSAGEVLGNPAALAQRSAERRAAIAQQLAKETEAAKKTENLRKAIIGTGAVAGTSVAGLGAYELYELWADMEPQDRVTVAAEVGDASPELSGLLRQANNEIASDSRAMDGDFAHYQQNNFGETHTYADRTVPGLPQGLLDPVRNEYEQALDSTYALVRDRNSLARIKAFQFIINNCSETDLNVLEDRYVSRLG